ncbi:GNAT family N-acetyltransferase [Marinomonas epiphytica]
MQKRKEWQIRDAELEDAPAILAILNQAFSKQGQAPCFGLLDVCEWLESTSQQQPFLVVENRQEVIAWCSLQAFYGLPAFDQALEISLYVENQHQGLGLGGALLRHIEIRAKHISFTHLIAHIYSGNQNSRNFFEKHQFSQWGKLPNIAQPNPQQTKQDLYILGKEYNHQ